MKDARTFRPLHATIVLCGHPVRPDILNSTLNCQVTMRLIKRVKRQPGHLSPKARNQAGAGKAEIRRACAQVDQGEIAKPGSQNNYRKI